ncbi:MAG: hypothetical protein NTV80_03200 [Verrucomicrobia bacterium]|nr:hypothetical protein [Verrucomicrobiota bacterium]
MPAFFKNLFSKLIALYRLRNLYWLSGILILLACAAVVILILQPKPKAPQQDPQAVWRVLSGLAGGYFATGNQHHQDVRFIRKISDAEKEKALSWMVAFLDDDDFGRDSFMVALGGEEARAFADTKRLRDVIALMTFKLKGDLPADLKVNVDEVVPLADRDVTIRKMLTYQEGLKQ